MTSRDFCYWMQGMFEVGGVKSLDERQTELIQRHLALVFIHEIDPSAGGPDIQEKLDAIHNGVAELKERPPAVVHHGHSGIGPVFRC